jgi:hypothetical protein
MLIRRSFRRPTGSWLTNGTQTRTRATRVQLVRMKQLNEAREILLDADKRREYDSRRSQSSKVGSKPAPQAAQRSEPTEHVVPTREPGSPATGKNEKFFREWGVATVALLLWLGVCLLFAMCGGLKW